MMTPLMLQCAMLMIAVLSCTVEGNRDPVTYCGACRALADELQYEIRKVNPSKTIDVGSFRINPDGTQVQNKVPLVKSEVFLTEILDGICEKMDDYSLYSDPETKEKSYKRFAPRDDEPFPSLNFHNFNFTPGEESTLKFACERVVEENDEEIISLVTQEPSSLAHRLCTEITGFCQGMPHSEL